MYCESFFFFVVHYYYVYCVCGCCAFCYTYLILVTFCARMNIFASARANKQKKNSTRREKECVFSLFCCCCWCELIACALDRVLLAYPARIVSESSLHISIDDLCASHTHTYRANVRTQYVVLFGLVVSPSIQSAFVFLWWLFGKCIPLHLKFSEHFVVMYCIYIFIFPFSSIVMHVMVLSSA